MNLDKILKNIIWFFGAAKLVNNFPDAIVIVNFEGVITQMNKRAGELFAISAGKYPLTINELIKDGMQKIKFSLKSKRVVLAQAEVYGRCFQVELAASKYKDGFCITFRDNTRLISDYETGIKIEKFNNEKNAMLVKLESDLKSPIESIIGFSKGLLDAIGGELSEKQAKYVNIINNNAKDLDVFIDKLLEFSYCESLLYEPEYKSFDAVSKIKEIIKDLKFENEKNEFTFDYSTLENRTVYTDIKAFEKIIRNITEVSYDMTENGNISLTLSEPNDQTSLALGIEEGGKYIQITLKDNGYKLEAKEFKSLCDPYFQADKGRKNLLRALRLGSASILVKRTAGFIDITPEITRGTTYNIVIPKQKDEDE